MKFHLRSIPKPPKFTDHTDPDSYYNLNRYFNECVKWFDGFEREVRVHMEMYEEYVKPPEEDETWHCLQFLEALMVEILGEIPEETLAEISELAGNGLEREI